jgi:serine protease Do
VQSLGSGFIIDPAGYVVTNNHVIEGADEITVILDDGDEMKATLVGTDEKTDLALLKVTSKNPLPTARMGDSDKARVGEWVMAIGDPFGLGGTVTTGIISARNRDINAGAYDDFIQTDAPINRGNSGGPLLNARGEVIGVNSQIETETGGNVGIGFAVPVNTVREVVSQLKANGKVEHAYLGVHMQDITEDVAETANLPVDEGVLIVTVVDESPAAEAGLKGGKQQVIVGGRSYVLGGDIVTRADGQAVAASDDLRTMIMAKSPGDPMTLDIQRGDSKRTVSVTLGQQPAQTGG